MVSQIGDSWKDQFDDKWQKFVPNYPSKPFDETFPKDITRIEFDALKNEVEELKKLLMAAKEFDDRTGQPHCEMDEKVKLIKAIAKIVGVDLGDVFGHAKPAKK